MSCLPPTSQIHWEDAMTWIICWDVKLNLRRKPIKSAEKLPPENQLSMFEEADKEEYILHCENSSIILRLHGLLGAQLKQTGMDGAFWNIEIPLAGTIAKLELNGVKLDVDGLAKIAIEFDGRLVEFRQKIFDLAGEEFNPNSIVELQNIIYEKLRLHERFKVKPKKIKLGNQMSTDEETLEKLAADELPRVQF